MSRYELVNVNDMTLYVPTSFRLIQQMGVSLLCLCIASQQEYFVLVCHAAEVLCVPEEDIKHLVGQLGVKAHSLKRSYLLLARSLNAIFIIEIVKSSIFEFSHVP